MPPDIIDWAIQQTDTTGVFLSLIPKPHILVNGVPAGGCFDCVGGMVRVATGRPRKIWSQTLVHEVCHMHQWREKTDLWNAQDIGGIDVGNFVNYWLTGMIELNWHQRNRYFGLVRQLELDCEMRTAETIGKMAFGIDQAQYIAQANAYIFFHEVALRNRVWIKPKSLTQQSRRLDELCPSEFLPADDYADVETWCDLHDFLLQKCAISLLPS